MYSFCLKGHSNTSELFYLFIYFFFIYVTHGHTFGVEKNNK